MASHFEEYESTDENIKEENKASGIYDSARNQFVKKVYSILMVQLLVTTCFVILNVISSEFR